jgi:hypothetical protein
MGLLWTDGFDSFAATADLFKKWGNVGATWAWGAATGRNGGGGVSCAAGGSAVLVSQTTALPGLSTGTYALAFYMKLTNAAPTGTISPLISLVDGATTMAGGLGLVVGRGITLLTASNAIAITGTTSVCDGNWHFIEWQFGLANSSSAPTALYIDGIKEWATTANMTNGTRVPTALRFHQNNAGIAFLGLDDVVVYGDSGFPNASSDYPLGQLAIDTLRPTSDSAVTWTPDSGLNNFSRVNEVNGDGDSSYVQTATVNNQDLYGYGSLGGVAPVNIWGAMVNSYIDNPVSGTQNFQAVCKSSGVTSTGTTTVCPTSYKIKQQAFNQDPNGPTNWTQSSINAATFGAKAV